MRLLNRLPSLGRIGRGGKRRLGNIRGARSELRLPGRRSWRLFGRRDRKREIGTLLGAGVVGAALAYFMDPHSGRRRRKVGGDRMAAAFRRAFRRVGRLARRTSAETYGMAQKLTHLKPEDRPALDDVTLAQKVQTEIFRDPDVPKGRINVNVENGVVVLRGELDRPEQIRELVEETRKIPGVRAVENLLHLAGTPPPSG